MKGRPPVKTPPATIAARLLNRETGLLREADLLETAGLECEPRLNRMLAATLRRCRTNLETRTLLKP